MNYQTTYDGEMRCYLEPHDTTKTVRRTME